MSRVFLIICIASFLSACSNEERAHAEHSQYVQNLWEKTISQSLKEPLWLSDFAYDASTSLMVPMHYSFKHPQRFDTNTAQEFDKFFEQVSFFFHPSQIESRVTKTQFMYFISQYLKLRANNGLWDAKDEKLFVLLNGELNLLWNQEEAWHWDNSLSFSGIKERILWKLNSNNQRFSYYNAFIDEEWFSLSAISDLIFIGKKIKIEYSFDAEKITEISNRLLQTYLSYENGYLYFQKGIWFDHRDYSHAGHNELSNNLAPKYIENIAIDSSHSHRYPLFLESMKGIAVDREFYFDVKKELMRTYNDNALTSDEIEGQFSILQTNYFDGSNGVYRYNYSTLGESNGYGPFQLSGTLFVGYYVFFESEKYQRLMRRMQSSFPLNTSSLELYLGASSSRNRHYLFDWPAYFNNGFAELFTYLSACYNGDLNSCEIKEQN